MALEQKRRLFMQQMPPFVHGSNVIPLHMKKHSNVQKQPGSSSASFQSDLWELRKQLVLQLAQRRNGTIHLLDVAAECNVSIRIAADWLKHFAMEGILSLVAGQQKIMAYSVNEAGSGQK
ncbi:hypothetical protein [Paenibacillus alba]|uniref:Helix-turn-helix domain-containing protein n=1 Tax=Paenibacillus alba TaxID=1197127 RepID=A0ABU6G1F6_9BACL|nr:hypothetical protein [Paenibacillus alba]MEC0227977.1 hypothetical protein [Paenibacillus alba]